MKNRFLTNQIFGAAILAASFLAVPARAQQQTAARATSQAAPQSATQPAAQGEFAEPRLAGAAPFLRTELFFGSDKPDGPDISREEFRHFLKEEITTRFPDGLTVLTGTGQFRDSENDKIIREKSMVLILLYPLSSWKEGNEKIEQIRKIYKERFKQQSVLRVDDPRPVMVSF
jgi:hypothetical protein